MSAAVADEKLGSVRLSAKPLLWLRSRVGDLTAGSTIVLVSLLVGCFNLYGSGALWPDGPQYSNAAAMIHDWLLSGKLSHPYLFAETNYAQYPAFHLPFHPPVYPGLLGLFFLLTGVSYVWARVFVALCLGVAGYFFYSILKKFEISRVAATACALLLVTTPEIARWSRDTMSEVPALALVLAGSYFFVRWLKTERTLDCCAAFILAELAFLSRVTTAGIIPAWFLLIVFTGNFRRLRSRVLILMASLYVVLNATWTILVSRFAKYEMGAGGAGATAGGRGLLARMWEAVSYYWEQLPRTAGWGLLIAAVCALAYALWLKKRASLTMFALAWLVSSVGFLLALKLVPEPRYFFYVLPGLALAVAILFSPHAHRLVRAYVAPALVIICLGVNVLSITRLPRGLVGYEAVADHLARSGKQGNILALSWFSQDFIFRYRADLPAVQRMVERGDRTLAIRLSDYGGFSGGLSVKPVILAHDREDVLSVMRRGRVRYLLTCAPDSTGPETRTEEMVLAHDVAAASPDEFALVGKFPLTIDFEGENFHGQLFLWEFKEELPAGPSELPVVVPTADMVIYGN